MALKFNEWNGQERILGVNIYPASPREIINRRNYWRASSWDSIAYYFLRAIRQDAAHQKSAWPRLLVIACCLDARSKPEMRKLAEQVGKKFAQDPELATAFEAVCRLTGRRAQKAWCRALMKPPTEKLTPEQRKERRIAGIKKRAEAREKHARKMLAQHERALARAERAVARWRKVVGGYERRAGASGARPGKQVPPGRKNAPGSRPGAAKGASWGVGQARGSMDTPTL